MGQCPSCQKCSDQPCVTHSELIFWGTIAAFVLFTLVVLLIILTHKIASKFAYKRGYNLGVKDEEQRQQQKNVEMQRHMSGAANFLAMAALRGVPLTTAASLASNPHLLNAIGDGGATEEYIGGGSATTTTATIMEPRASFRFGGGGGGGTAVIAGNGYPQSRGVMGGGANQQQMQQSEPMLPLNTIPTVPAPSQQQLQLQQPMHGRYLTTNGKSADSSTYIV